MAEIGVRDVEWVHGRVTLSIQEYNAIVNELAWTKAELARLYGQFRYALDRAEGRQSAGTADG